LLCGDLQEVLQGAEIVLVGTTAVEKETLAASLQPRQIVIDLANLEKARRPDGREGYEGICW